MGLEPQTSICKVGVVTYATSRNCPGRLLYVISLIVRYVNDTDLTMILHEEVARLSLGNVVGYSWFLLHIKDVRGTFRS